MENTFSNVNVIHLKLTNFEDGTGKNIKERNLNWSQSHYYLYRILIIGISGQGKANGLLNLLNSLL